MSEAEGFVELLQARRWAEPDRLFARFEGAPISFATLGAEADAFASGLRRLGVARGDRVAVMLRNSRAALAVAFGLARAGAVWVPVNVQQRGEGLRYILDHSEPRLVIADADLVATIRESGSQRNSTSPSRAADTSAAASPAKRSMACVSCTPLGAPVVPEV